MSFAESSDNGEQKPPPQRQGEASGEPASGPSPDFVKLTREALAEDAAYLAAATDPPPGQTPTSHAPRRGRWLGDIPCCAFGARCRCRFSCSRRLRPSRTAGHRLHSR